MLALFANFEANYERNRKKKRKKRLSYLVMCLRILNMWFQRRYVLPYRNVVRCVYQRIFKNKFVHKRDILKEVTIKNKVKK